MRGGLAKWVREHLRPSDGPDAGRPLRLEPWQAGILRAIDREPQRIHVLMAAAQCGKSLLAVGLALHAASRGRGALFASATETSARDLSRRLDAAVEASADIAAMFPMPKSGPGARAKWNDRRTTGPGWIGLAAAGSASQLASRTAQLGIADEVARWPSTTRSKEAHPLDALRARLTDWGRHGRLFVLSSPVLQHDAIGTLHADGDRRRMTYPCDCGMRTTFDWESVTGREKGEVPMVACQHCGQLYDDRGRKRLLRRGRWEATVEARDEDVASYQLSRLDSRRSTLADICMEWRRARRAAERGQHASLATFRNLVCGLPSDQGVVDVDRVFERDRRRSFDLGQVVQQTVGVDVQQDRLVMVRLGWTINDKVMVLEHGEIIGDPAESEVWQQLEVQVAQAIGGMRPSVIAVDAGYLTQTIRDQCAKRRWWIPVVGRSGDGIPAARSVSRSSGLATAGKHDLSAWWSSAVRAGRVLLPWSITRADISDLCAGEHLTVDGGRIVWRPVPGRSNHRWDAALLALFGRRFRTLSGRRAPLRLVSV